MIRKLTSILLLKRKKKLKRGPLQLTANPLRLRNKKKGEIIASVKKKFITMLGVKSMEPLNGKPMFRLRTK